MYRFVIKMLWIKIKRYLCTIFAVNLDKIKISFFIKCLKTNTINKMIQVSESASKKIVDMMKDDGFDATKDYVRVGVKTNK